MGVRLRISKVHAMATTIRVETDLLGGAHTWGAREGLMSKGTSYVIMTHLLRRLRRHHADS